MNLRHHNTLGLPARSQQLIYVRDASELAAISDKLQGQPRLILGGGSNVVLHAPIDATVLINEIRGRQIDSTGMLTAGGGENWHDLVMWSLEQGIAGLENLALIPGTVGAAPVQNIGAYGVELSSILHSLTAWDFTHHRFQNFLAAECGFGYRDSIFKHTEIQGRWDTPRFFITQVRLQLTPVDKAKMNIGYGDLALELNGHTDPTPLDIAHAVIAIRQRKLPDPKVLGNVGSFFKNPVISSVQANSLKVLHPDIPQYPVTDRGDDVCKISAAWLIERCGFKGARRGDVGVHEAHALVLVNYGEGTGREILALCNEIQQAVVAKFGVYLEPEPVFIP